MASAPAKSVGEDDAFVVVGAPPAAARHCAEGPGRPAPRPPLRPEAPPLSPPASRWGWAKRPVRETSMASMRSATIIRCGHEPANPPREFTHSSPPTRTRFSNDRSVAVAEDAPPSKTGSRSRPDCRPGWAALPHHLQRRRISASMRHAAAQPPSSCERSSFTGAITPLCGCPRSQPQVTRRVTWAAARAAAQQFASGPGPSQPDLIATAAAQPGNWCLGRAQHAERPCPPARGRERLPPWQRREPRLHDDRPSEERSYAKTAG